MNRRTPSHILFLILVFASFLVSEFVPALEQKNNPYTVVAYYYPWYGGSDNPHWPMGVAHRPWIGYYYAVLHSQGNKSI
jgi:hypothetical protein